MEKTITVSTGDDSLHYSIEHRESGRWYVYSVTREWGRTLLRTYDTAGKAVEGVLDWGIE